MNKKYIISILYIIGIGIFLFLVLDFGINKIIINIQKTGWWFLPIIVLWVPIYFFNAAAWYVIIGERADAIGFRKIFYVTVGGFAINYITPFVMLGGEPYRIFVLKKYMNTGNSVASVTVFAMMHMLSHIVLWLIAIPILLIFYYQETSYLKWLFLVTFIVLLLIMYFIFSRHKKGFFTPLFNLLSKISFIHSLISKYEKLQKGILEIDERIKNFYMTRKKDFYLSLGLEFISRVIASLEFWFALLAIGIKATIIDSFLINAGISLLLNIVFFMPLELGAREGGLYLVFRILSIGSGEAIYISLVSRIRELFWIMIGLIFVRMDISRKSNIKTFLTGETANNGIDSHE